MNCERDIRFELLACLCSKSTDAGMYAIQPQRNTITDKNILDAVNKITKGYQKFSATPKYMVGVHSEHGYARSLARFAANLGPVVWTIASKKIERALPSGEKYGPGWVGEYEAFPLPRSALHEQNFFAL